MLQVWYSNNTENKNLITSEWIEIVYGQGFTVDLHVVSLQRQQVQGQGHVEECDEMSGLLGSFHG